MSIAVVDSLISQVLAGSSLSREQAQMLADWPIDALLELMWGANRIRCHFRGNQVQACGIVAAKVGRCSENCAFCSQSAHHCTPVQPVELTDQQVLDAARDSARIGATAFGVVNSGYQPTDAEVERWGTVAAGVRRFSGMKTACASLGVLNERQAHRLAELGVQRYNHNLQTSRRFFSRIITTHRYEDRLATLRYLQAAGIELCCGALFGMGESWEDRLDLAFELAALQPSVVPINFLIPIAGTPLENTHPLTPLECLKIIAIYRFVLPKVQIKIAGGREVHLRSLQSSIFWAGADGIITGNYLTTCGQGESLDQRMIRDLGLQCSILDIDWSTLSSRQSCCTAACDHVS